MLQPSNTLLFYLLFKKRQFVSFLFLGSFLKNTRHKVAFPFLWRRARAIKVIFRYLAFIGPLAHGVTFCPYIKLDHYGKKAAFVTFYQFYALFPFAISIPYKFLFLPQQICMHQHFRIQFKIFSNNTFGIPKKLSFFKLQTKCEK